MSPATSPSSRSGKDEAERRPARLVGGRLREVLRGRGLTLDGVAGAAGFTKSFVRAVERGEGVVDYVLSPRGERRAQVIETHNGELVITTVLEGAVEFRFGERTTTVQAGDTVSYSPAEPHEWRNLDAENPAAALFFEVPAEH